MDIDDWLNRIDLEAIADPTDKLSESEFFLGLASQEANRERFRWLISAFLNAAYSFFETSALSAFFRFTDEGGEPHADDDALEVLRTYVVVMQDKKRPSYVKTAGLHEVTKQLYEFRKKSAHHTALSIMATGSSLPADYHFGNMKGEGTAALEFCTNAMKLMRTVQLELDVC